MFYQKTPIKILSIFIISAILLGVHAEDEVAMNSVKSSFREIKGEIIELEWCGTNEIYSDETFRVDVAENIDDSFDTRLFVLTTLGKVMKSTNYGKSWLQITDKFQNLNSTEDFFATEISISPIDGKTVYIWGSLESSYVSEQCGKTWKRINHPPGLFDFRFHRTDKNAILAHKQQICNKYSKDNCKESHRLLYLSQDAGKTFTLISEHVLEATWNRMNNFFDHKKPGIIAAIDEKSGPRVVYSSDFWETVQTIQEGGDNFYQAEYFLFVTIKPTDSEKNYELRIATLFDDFKPYLEMNKIQLPFEANDHLSFTILRSDGPKVFITVVHENEGFKQSNVYVSDWKGYELSLSLLNNVRSAEGECDFEKIDSNEGVYIANVYDSEKVKHMRTNGNKKESSLQDLSAYKKTVISYDNGANWHIIKAPTLKSSGKNYHCSGDCSLHLLGRTSNRKGYMYSSSNAPGIIVALGNVGTHLTTKNHELNTYISSDGGHTWAEVLQGPHVFEIGDHGGIILAAPAFNKTTQIKYSWDEGRTWGIHTISGGAFDVNSISTEPSNMEQRFVLSGTRHSSNAETEATVIGLIDLSDLHTRGCVGSEHPDRPNSDYETWIPTNFQGEQCVFGKKFKYVRRKPDAKCYNSINVEQKKLAEECPCTDEDWECDFGFYRQNNDGPCIPRSSKFSQENIDKPPADCHYSYTISKGYRKIPGIYCLKGVDLAPEVRLCPPKIIQAREEEQTEEYKHYKEQQEILKHLIAAERQATQQATLDKQTHQKNFSGSSILSSLFMVLGVGSVLGIVFYFREHIRNAISAIGEIGDRRVRQQKQSGQQSGKYASLSSKNQKNVAGGLVENNTLFGKAVNTNSLSSADYMSGNSNSFNNAKEDNNYNQQQGIHIEADEPQYDLEDQEFIHEEKPVLLRDQENFDDYD